MEEQNAEAKGNENPATSATESGSNTPKKITPEEWRNFLIIVFVFGIIVLAVIKTMNKM